MKISEAGGEETIISWFRDHAGPACCALEEGIGDDCAVLSPSDKPTLVTTDILVENTHFRTDITDYYNLGWKSVAVNISDIAAMGGIPTLTFLSIGLPDMQIDDAFELFRGISECSHHYGSTIAGGDTVSSSSGITISITQMGTAGAGGCLKRSEAIPGDKVVVTGTLGDSLAGLKLLLRDGLVQTKTSFPYLTQRHIRPEARLDASKAIAQTGLVHSMMDLSDGLCKDLKRLCLASKTGAVIYADSLPVSDELAPGAAAIGTTALNLAAAGGEDYELLFTCDAKDSEQVIECLKKINCRAAVIGEITPDPAVRLISEDKKDITWPDPWEHF